VGCVGIKPFFPKYEKNLRFVTVIVNDLVDNIDYLNKNSSHYLNSLDKLKTLILSNALYLRIKPTHCIHVHIPSKTPHNDVGTIFFFRFVGGESDKKKYFSETKLFVLLVYQ